MLESDIRIIAGDTTMVGADSDYTSGRIEGG
jgi:hypothetical protein